MSTIDDLIKNITNFDYLVKINGLVCLFNNSGEYEKYGGKDYHKYYFSKKFKSFKLDNCCELEKFSELDEKKNQNSQTSLNSIKDDCKQVIQEATNIIINNEQLSYSILTNFTKYISDDKTFETTNSKEEFNTEFDYKIIPDLIGKIDTLKKRLLKLKKNYSYNNIIDNIPAVESIYIETDREWTFDFAYGYELSDNRQFKKTDASDAKGKVEYVLPTKKEVLTALCANINSFSFYESNKCVYGISSIIKDDCNNLSKLIDGFISYCNRLKKDIRNMDSKTNNMEQKSKQIFLKTLKSKIRSDISKKNLNKEEINKKFTTLKRAISREDAVAWIKKVIKKTGANVTVSKKGVISIAKLTKSKKVKKKNTTKKSSSKKGSNVKTAMAATGATVAATKIKTSKKQSSISSSSNSKDNKKTNNKKKNVKQGIVSTIPTIAALKALKKQVQSSSATKISNIKTEASNKISAITGEAEDRKKIAEIEKNNKIKEINENAANRISKIDPNDSSANEKIENIQKETENEINDANTEYETKVKEIDQSKNTAISDIESNREKDIKSVNDSTKNEVDSINNDIEKSSKSKSLKESSKNTLTEKSTDNSTEAKVEQKEYNSTVKDDDVTTSEQSVDDSSAKVEEAVNKKQEEITNVEQAKENTDSGSDVSDSSSGGSVAQPETNTSQEQTTQVNTNDTSSNASYSDDTSYSDSSSSYNSDNSYSDSSYSSDNYNTGSETKAADINSSNTGLDQSNLKTDSTVKSTFDIKKDTSSTKSSTSSAKDIDDISSISSSKSTSSSSKSSGLGAAIPIGLGVAATGAAAVAGVRYVKNKKLNEDYDENYDDENNEVYDDEIPSDSAYMADDYLGPEGSSYTEVPDDNKYTNAEALEEEAGVNDFSEDAALNELN